MDNKHSRSHSSLTDKAVQKHDSVSVEILLYLLSKLVNLVKLLRNLTG